MPVDWQVHDFSRECGARYEQYRCTLTEPHRWHQQWAYDTPGDAIGHWRATWGRTPSAG